MGRFDHLEMGNSLPLRPDDDSNQGQVDQYFFLAKASRAFEDGEHEKALKFYSRALEYDINLAEAWVGQIRCLIELRELQEAIIWAERALDRLQNSADILAARAVAELRMGKLTNAVGFADAALASREVSPYVWVARGEVMIEQNILNAKSCFLKAVESSPSNAAVHSWIGRAYSAHNCPHEALTHFRRAVQLDNDAHACWYWIGNCDEILNEIEDAKLAYRRAVAANPNFHEARDAIRRLEAKGAMSRLCHGVKRFLGSR